MAPAFALTVEVDGTAATPDAAGRYVVKPGQSVMVRSNEGAAWVGNDLGSGVTRTDVDTGSAQWVSRFANPSAGAPGSYRVTASTSDGRSLSLSFTVQTGDYRNGEYTVYAGNGTRQRLRINFDAATYTLTDSAGDVDTGTLTAPVAPAKDWTVQSSRTAGFNAASLRSLGDTIVGALPLAVPYAAPGAYKAYPVIATRALLLSQNRLDGVFNRLQIQYLVGGGGQSALSQVGIYNNGTVVRQCAHLTIYRIETCPAGSVVTSRLTPDPDNSGIWRLTHPDTGALMGRIGVAMINGEKTYLAGGASPADGLQLLSIGLPSAAADPTFTSSGWSTDGTLDHTVSSPTTYDLTQNAGVPTTENLTLTPLLSPPGLHSLSDGVQIHFMLRSQTLELVVGARSSARAGFLHLGIVD